MASQGKGIYRHQYPPILMRYPRLIHLVHAWNKKLQLRSWYIHKALPQLIQEHEKKTGTLLDVGCGEGQYLFKLAQQLPQWRCIGIDRHLAHLNFGHAYARAVGRKNLHFICQELPGPPPLPAADWVLCIGVLQYMDSDEDVLRQIHACLAPHGHLVLYVPVRGQFLTRVYRWLFRRFQNYEDVQARKRIYTEDGLLTKVTDAGFAIRSSTPTYGFWGKLGHEIYHSLLTGLVHLPMIAKAPFALALIVLFPFLLLCNQMDMIRPVRSGNGMLLIAQAVPPPSPSSLNT